VSIGQEVKTMSNTNRWLLMTSAAALCAAPMLAFGQANTGGSSMQPQTTQTTPQQGPLGGAPAARGAATTGSDTGSAPGAPVAQQRGNAPDGAPGNPPSTATQRAVDSVTGQRTDPDGTGNNPPGTAAGRAIDRATSGTAGTTTTAPSSNTATGATSTTMAVDSAALQNGRRASRVIGSNVYNEDNDSIGEVDDIIVPQAGGQPVAIISVGGFLGIGARLVAVPYQRLQFNAERERWMLPGATKESLESLPAHEYQDGNRRG
jgi:hypothetical protein